VSNTLRENVQLRFRRDDAMPLARAGDDGSDAETMAAQIADAPPQPCAKQADSRALRAV
jgi:hypothetical protein